MGEVIGPAEGRDHTRRQALATTRRQRTLRADCERPPGRLHDETIHEGGTVQSVAPRGER